MSEPAAASQDAAAAPKGESPKRKAEDAPETAPDPKNPRKSEAEDAAAASQDAAAAPEDESQKKRKAEDTPETAPAPKNPRGELQSITEEDIDRSLKRLQEAYWRSPPNDRFTEKAALIVFPEMKVPNFTVQAALGEELMDGISAEARVLLQRKYGNEVPPYEEFKAVSNKMAEKYMHRVG